MPDRIKLTLDEKLDRLLYLELKLFPQKQLLRSLENSGNSEVTFTRKLCLAIIVKIESESIPLKKQIYDTVEKVPKLEIENKALKEKLEFLHNESYSYLQKLELVQKYYLRQKEEHLNLTGLGKILGDES